MRTTTDMQLVAVEKLVPYVNNARTHSSEQIMKLRSSLREFGFVNPVIIDRDFNVIAGHGRLEAAKAEKMAEVPCVFADFLTEAQRNCDGTAEKMAATMQDNLAGQLTILKSQLEELAISIGEILMPYIRQIVGWIQGLVDWLNSLDEGTKKIIVTVALVAAALEPVLIVIGKVVGAVGTIMTVVLQIASAISGVIAFVSETVIPAISAVVAAIGWVSLAIAAVVAILVVLYNKCGWFRDAVNAIWTQIKEFFVSAWEVICSFFTETIPNAWKKNRGELPQYYVEGTHPAIIDKNTFDYVQAEMERRRELGALANKSLNTCCFIGKIKCPHCGVSYMHNRRTDRGLMEFWNCGSKKKKKVGAGCSVGGTINHQNLMKACADILGTEEFDEDVFLDRVDHIEVLEKYTLEFFFKDGDRITRDCPNTGHQDCWTAEYRAATSEKRRKYGTNPRGATCFTGRIKCAECGNNYRQQTRKRKNGEKYHMFSCATTNTCGNNSIHGDDLQRLSAEAMGLDAFDASAFSERIDHVVISKGGRIAFHFKVGGLHEAFYSTKRKAQPWTEESRKKQAKGGDCSECGNYSGNTLPDGCAGGREAQLGK